MSKALLRRNSSKKGLQNLMRLMTQRSIEDAEEVERERRRRARESMHRRNSDLTPEDSSPESELLAEDNMDLKASSSLSLEEDEGFSDWTQRRERQRQKRLQELNLGGEEEEDDKANLMNKSVPIKTTQASIMSTSQHQRQAHEEIARVRKEDERRKESEEKAIREKTRVEENRRTEILIPISKEDIQSPNTEVEGKKEIKVSYTSKAFIRQEPKHTTSNSNVTTVKVMPHTRTNRSIRRTVGPDEEETIPETAHRLGKIRQSLQEKESQELEQLRHRQTEAEQELEELKRRREERRQVREEEERQKEEEEQQRLAKEEEERRQMKEDIERRRMEAAERIRNLSTSSVEGDELFSPLSPKISTNKITEKTESLNRSLKKSNSFKKTHPLLLMSKIDDKMEQYAHAVENSQEPRAVKLSGTDLPNSPEIVAYKKNLFEAGEAWSQSQNRAATCKDVKSGDVMQKKNMWEIIGDSSGKSEARVKGSAAGKKYKFVVTGHGKYEKIYVDDQTQRDFNGKSDLFHSDC
ncbi:non-muscle caldesmon isoform X2 [Cololabis saira]|uniref:non-muscle caldesmon isoform X2 n=1 Tax=Cololabis saira TaxID=129043 RepID=UPI002AD38AE0|nr:non-muscle caldesmon isoform X2 [Cololabis saira]